MRQLPVFDLNAVFMDDLVYTYALSMLFPNSPSVSRQIIESESPGFVFGLKRDDLMELFGGNATLVERICNPQLLEQSRKEVEWAAGKGVKLLAVTSGEYPCLLKECSDAPLLLFYIGGADLNAHFNLSIVGTRMATVYGREICGRIVESLAACNVMIVSGMAYGIDVSAHKAALEYNLPTVGVLPCGIDMIYPSAHRGIALKMLDKGGILTEFPRGTDVRRWQFIKRNRIIAGMSRAVILAESRIKGGAMITAEFASSYGRDIYAVPGRVDDSNSFGCNYLISKDVARICLPYSLKENLGLDATGGSLAGLQPNLFSQDDDKKQKILLSLKNNLKADIDTLCAESALPFNDVATALLELELEGIVTMTKGNRYELRNPNSI